MANENICVFCGEKAGVFRSVEFNCAGTIQVCCKDCAKELKKLSEEDLCRRILQFGYAHTREAIEERLRLITKAEECRPACLRCGSKMKFEAVQYLDNSPFLDRLTSEGFEVLPTYCESCGKYEFYKYDIVKKNKYIAYLISKDTLA